MHSTDGEIGNIGCGVSDLDRNLFFTAMEKSPCFQIRNIVSRIYIYGECSVSWGSLTQNEVSVWAVSRWL